jgi:hypothetical protein
MPAYGLLVAGSGRFRNFSTKYDGSRRTVSKRGVLRALLEDCQSIRSAVVDMEDPIPRCRTWAYGCTRVSMRVGDVIDQTDDPIQQRRPSQR